MQCLNVKRYWNRTYFLLGLCVAIFRIERLKYKGWIGASWVKGNKSITGKVSMNKGPVIEGKYQYKTLKEGQCGWKAETSQQWGRWEYRGRYQPDFHSDRHSFWDMQCSPVWSPDSSLSHHPQSILYSVISRAVLLKHQLTNVTCLFKILQCFPSL